MTAHNLAPCCPEWRLERCNCAAEEDTVAVVELMGAVEQTLTEVSSLEYSRVALHTMILALRVVWLLCCSIRLLLLCWRWARNGLRLRQWRGTWCREK
tara:strand:+ start:910 stop:1203 length:294 start_codon:yes stop_codon:yes gene_type:complete